MERKGGCCLAPRYEAGGQAWKIMLKFRPIAPKPAAMAPAPVPVPASAAGAGKGKRKALAAGSGRKGRKPKKAATVAAAHKVDLHKDKHLSSPSSSSSSSGMTFVDSSAPPPPPPPPPPTLKHAPSPEKAGFSAVAPRRPVALCVTVESVTGTWRGGQVPSPSAAASGGGDAPAFVSDQWGRVTWMNLAFNRAVSGGGNDGPSASDVGVALAAKDGAAVPAWGTCAGFTCRVRVTHACPRRGSLVAPCDVWRLDAGGYLWRLDLQATLTLSLGVAGLL